MVGKDSKLKASRLQNIDIEQATREITTFCHTIGMAAGHEHPWGKIGQTSFILSKFNDAALKGNHSFPGGDDNNPFNRFIHSSKKLEGSHKSVSTYQTSDTKRLEPLCLITVATAAADLLKPRNAVSRLEDATERATIAGFNETYVQARVVSQGLGNNVAPQSEIKLPSHLMIAIYLVIPTDEAKNIKAQKYKDQIHKQTHATKQI